MNKNLIGQKFGRLTVLYEVEQSRGKRKGYLCKCDCGNEKIIDYSNLRERGGTRSCGCLSVKHGYSKRGKKHKLYYIWRAMIERCGIKKNKQYINYGARGIKVCDEWRSDAGAFINWCIANGWKIGLTIDRINNDGNYEPENIRFVSQRINNLNQRFLKKNNKSGYRGINWDKKSNKWRARIRINSVRYNLGLFKSKHLAAAAYNAKAYFYGYPLNKIEGTHYAN